MITRFRVEATHSDKDALQEQLLDAAAKIQEVASDRVTDPKGAWEITDDRIEGKPGAYRGRMVFVFAEGEYV
jgi:hypothetical protein